MLSRDKKINFNQFVLFLIVIFLNQQTAAKPNFSGIWISGVSVSARDSFWPKDLPFTELGREAQKKAGTLEDPAFQCIIGFGRIISAGFPTEIIQTDKQVTILYEYNHQVRRIFTDGREHPKKVRPSLMGHSIGYWNESTLIVDTVGAKSLFFRLAGIPYSDKAHFIEKIRLLDDGETLENIIMVDDSEFYTQKWEARIYLSLDPTTTILEYDCTVREHLKPIK